jgi:excisionase family DNA binding protein
MIPQMVTVQEVATQLGVSHWTIRCWCRQGRIPFVKLGRRVLFKVEDLEALLAASYQPAFRPQGPSS